MNRQHGDGHWQVPVLSASATRDTGIEALADAMEQHHDMLCSRGLLQTRRRRYQGQWILKRLQDEFGSYGVARLGGEEEILRQLEGQQQAQNQAQDPALFGQYEALRKRIYGFYNDTQD